MRLGAGGSAHTEVKIKIKILILTAHTPTLEILTAAGVCKILILILTLVCADPRIKLLYPLISRVADIRSDTYASNWVLICQPGNALGTLRPSCSRARRAIPYDPLRRLPTTSVVMCAAPLSVTDGHFYTLYVLKTSSRVIACNHPGRENIKRCKTKTIKPCKTGSAHTEVKIKIKILILTAHTPTLEILTAAGVCKILILILTLVCADPRIKLLYPLEMHWARCAPHVRAPVGRSPTIPYGACPLRVLSCARRRCPLRTDTFIFNFSIWFYGLAGFYGFCFTSFNIFPARWASAVGDRRGSPYGRANMRGATGYNNFILGSAHTKVKIKIKILILTAHTPTLEILTAAGVCKILILILTLVCADPRIKLLYPLEMHWARCAPHVRAPECCHVRGAVVRYGRTLLVNYTIC
eukprot:sb/3465193/